MCATQVVFMQSLGPECIKSNSSDSKGNVSAVQPLSMLSDPVLRKFKNTLPADTLLLAEALAISTQVLDSLVLFQDPQLSANPYQF